MAENLPDGRSYAICIHDAWDYMLALMKMMALFWILWHFHTMRRHLFIFSESWCLTIASVNDLILSLAFNVIRFRLLGPTEPNIDLLLSLLHAHLSVSVTVLLALLPEVRLWEVIVSSHYVPLLTSLYFLIRS
uniref:Uncharacterized protein n=1 Tax=Eptatretus burgeri TaxID=7764 RepID=A0A8C4PZM2_EPTBU